MKVDELSGEENLEDLEDKNKGVQTTENQELKYNYNGQNNNNGNNNEVIVKQNISNQEEEFNNKVNDEMIITQKKPDIEGNFTMIKGSNSNTNNNPSQFHKTNIAYTTIDNKITYVENSEGLRDKNGIEKQIEGKNAEESKNNINLNALKTNQ